MAKLSGKIIALIAGAAGSLFVGLAGDFLSDSVSPTGNYFGDLLLNSINPPSPPETKILDVRDINSVKIENGGSTSSNSVMVNFSGTDNYQVKSFECSLDGSEWSACKSPYRFSKPPGIYSFSVRAIDNDDTRDPTSADYDITIMTSAAVQGVVKKTDKPVPFVMVIADNKYSDLTIEGGTFILQNVPKGNHSYEILNKTSPLYRDKFYILPDDTLKDLGVIDISTAVIHAGSQPSSRSNILQGDNDAYVRENAGNAGNAGRPVPMVDTGVRLVYNESLKENSTYHDVNVGIHGSPEITSNIERVTYYLHPTFKPDVITKYAEDDFEMFFSAWGQFDLNAKVYFNSGKIQDLSTKIVFGSNAGEKEFEKTFPIK